MPKVSVIIPTYNRAEYLPDAIDSVLAQTFRDFEVIIIDDGSTDNTREIIEKYIKRYPQIIRPFYQMNSGASVARNKGIEEARGEYIAFLDSDDVWLSKKLERQVSVLERDKKIGFFVMFCSLDEKDS